LLKNKKSLSKSYLLRDEILISRGTTLIVACGYLSSDQLILTPITVGIRVFLLKNFFKTPAQKCIYIFVSTCFHQTAVSLSPEISGMLIENIFLSVTAFIFRLVRL